MNLGSLIGYLGLDTKDWDKGLDDAEGGLAKFAKRGAVVAAAAGVAIAGAVTAAVVQGMNIEAANDKLAAQLGLSAAESERVGGVAGKLYANAYGESLGDVNDAVAAVMGSIEGMNNASSADLQAVTANAMDFATAMGVDVTSAATTAGILLKNGLAADAGEAFDLMTVASQEAGPAMVDPILEAAKEYSVNFASMGFSGREAMALLVDASAQGEVGIDKMGDSIKEFSIRATDMSATSVAAYDLLGMSAEDMSNRILAGGTSAQTATQEIVSGLLGIEDPALRANTAIQLFGSPLEDLGVVGIPTFLQSLQGANGELENVAGAAGRMGAALNDNASSNIESFKRQAISAFVTVVGGQVLPIVNSVASTLATQFGPAVAAVGGFLAGSLVPALQSAAQWMAANQTPIMVVAGLITAVFLPGLIALGVQSLISGAQSLAGWVMTQAGAVAGAAAHSLAVVKMVAGWVLMGVQSLIQAARMAAAWLIAMGPVGWVIAAVVGLVALIVANWDTVVAWTRKAWAWVVDAVKSGVQFMVNLFLNFTVVGLIIKHWDTIKNAFSNGVSAAVGFVRELPGKILSALGNFGSLLVDAGASLIRGFINGIKNAFGAVKDTLGDLTSKLTSWKGPPAKDRVLLWGAGQMVIGGFINGMESQYGAVRGSLAGLTNGIAGMQPLALAGPSWSAATPASQVGTSSATGGASGALFHADTVNVIEGTPQDIAQELAYQGRTRGW